MNIDRGKESFTEAEIGDLRARLKAYKEEVEVGWNPLADRVGDVGGSTLSAWCSGAYAGDMRAVAWKVNRFFLAEAARQELELVAPIVPGFRMTPTAKRMTAQLEWARRGRMVVISGHPGVGKTATFEQFCAVTPNAFLATMTKATQTPTSMMMAILKACGSNSPYSSSRGLHLQNAIIDRLKGMNALMIVDEAQFLDDAAVEQLRSLYDMAGCGVCLAGNPEVMSRIRRSAATPAFAQLARRVSWPAHYMQPTDGDLNVILDAWEVTRESERTFLKKVSALGGGLGSITQCLEMATLDSRSTDEERTLGHLKAAWQQRTTPQAA